MESLRSTLLATVDRSPQMASAHDRAGWVGLFAANGRIEDPVGSSPHAGPEQIARFYDTFIAPRDIVFHRDLDIVSDSTVIRDLELEVGMGATVRMRIPAVLRYDLSNELSSVPDEWQIKRLRAYWELPAMMVRFLGNGPSAAPQALNLTRALLRNQGLGGSAGFMSGFRGARVRGKRTLRAFLDANAAGDQVSAWRCLAPGATITAGERNPLKFGAFSDELKGSSCTKMIGAGSSLTASMRGGATGVLIAEMADGGGAIAQLSYFAE